MAGAKQVLRKALGEKPVADIKIPFTQNKISVPGMAPQFSNMAVEGGLQGLQELVPQAILKAGAKAPEIAAKALGFTKRLLKTDKMQKDAFSAAQTMLDQGIVKPGASAENMKEGIAALKEKSGQAIGDALAAGGNGFNVGEAVKELNAMRPQYRGGKWDIGHQKIDEAVATLQAMGNKPLSLAEANQAKGIFNDATNWYGNTLQDRLDKAIAGTVKNSVDKQLERVVGPANAADFVKNKKLYQHATRAEDAINNRLSSEFGNRTMSLTDLIMAAPELAAGNPMRAIGILGGKRLVERYGHATAASLLDSAVKNPAAMQAIKAALQMRRSREAK